MSLWVVDFVFLLLNVCIGDFQARVSSSSEGCSTSQKKVKVHTEYLEYGIYNPLIQVRSVQFATWTRRPPLETSYHIFWPISDQLFWQGVP